MDAGDLLLLVVFGSLGYGVLLLIGDSISDAMAPYREQRKAREAERRAQREARKMRERAEQSARQLFAQVEREMARGRAGFATQDQARAALDGRGSDGNDLDERWF